MKKLALYVMLAAAAPLFAEIPKEPASDLALHTAKVPGLEVSFVDYHWQPDLFEAMELGSRTIPEAQRDWVLAKVAVEPRPLKFEGVTLAPGSYALSLFPNKDGKGMTIELRRIDVRQIYPKRNVMAQTPPGKTMYSAVADFNMLDPLALRLDITASETAEGITLTVNYGNRQLDLKLTR